MPQTNWQDVLNSIPGTSSSTPATPPSPSDASQTSQTPASSGVGEYSSMLESIPTPGGSSDGTEEHTASDTTPPNANEGFLKKTWRVINTPILEDLGAPSSINGVGPDWLKGVERGGYKLAMGFTSPLSLALTIGTLGTGGFIESAGANILKDTLMAGGADAAEAANEVAQYGKAAEAATKAYNVTGQSVKQAVEATGMDYNRFRALGNTLYDRGLTDKDFIGGNIVQRGLSATLRNLPDMDAATAQKLAKYTQLGIDAGFTGQQLHAAVQTVPQVFDALRDGRYDDAFEYLTEGAVGGGLGLVGASHALNQAGETFSSINERKNLRPSDENQKLHGFLGDREQAHQAANQSAANLLQNLNDLAGANTGTTFSPSIFQNIKAGIKYTFQSAAEKQAFRDKQDRLLVGLETGNDPKMAGHFANAFSEAVGLPIASDRGNANLLARFAPGEFASMEDQVRRLGINKPFHEIGTDDIKEAGGSKELQSNWADYIKNWALLGRKNSENAYVVPNEKISQNTTISALPATKYAPPAMLLNPSAQELIGRAIEDLQGEGKMKNLSKRGWAGFFTNGDGIRNIIRILNKQSKDVPPESRGGYEHAMQSLETALPHDGVILAREGPDLENTYNHEAAHHWQNQVRQDVRKTPQSIPEMSGKVSRFMGTPLATRAAATLKHAMGYAQASPRVLFDEIGAHLAEDSPILREAAGFTDADMAQLAKDYISVYNKEHLASFPSENPLIQGAMEANGYKGINAGAATSIRRGAAEGFGATSEQSGNAAGGVRNPAVSQESGGIPDEIQQRLQQWVDEAKNKLKPEQKEYLKRWIKAYRAVADGLSDDESSIVKRLRGEDDTNWNIGNTMELITNHIDNHFHHLWGPDATDIGNDLTLQGRTGQLATTVTQARHRVWQTMAEGLLKGRKLVGDDPMAVIAWDRANILKAAANRNLIDGLRDNNIRGSDGRPLVVLSGEGHVIQEPNGGNPAAIINPNQVRDIRIAKALVDQLHQSGELERFLRRGDIIDVSRQFRANNIDAAINKLEEIGISKNPEFDPEGSVILRKDIQTLKGIKDGSVPVTALDEINNRWNPPQYVWHPQDYVTPANRTLQGWNWLTKTDDGTSVIARSDVKFHPEAANYLINRLGLDTSYLRENKGIGKITGPVLKGTTKAKAVLLSFSPFHLMQEALRGIMLGVNPLRVNPIGEILDRSDIANAVHEGATIAPDKRAIQEYSAGVAQHAPLISKIPILGKAMDWYQDFLFNRYIPSLKAQAIEVMAAKYRSAHPDWTDQAIGKAVAEHVNNAFGGQNWRAMGRAAATQDWFHLFALAPDWLESEMRFAASTIRGGLGNKNFSREQTLKMAAGLWGVARVLNLLTTGNMHLEAPFGVATKDKDGREVVYSIRTMPTDILHMASDPSGFLKGRLSPFARLSEEALTGRDVFGRKLAPGDLAIDIARNMAPIPFQTLGQIESGQSSEVGNFGQLAKASGFTSTVYRTQAEKLAIDLASQHNEDGPLDPQKLKHLETISHIEDGMRSGRMTQDQLAEARDFGGLTERDYKKIRENLKLTHGLDPDTARMVSKVSGLPATDALQVWDTATPKEKGALIAVMKKKKQTYMAKAMRDQTPQERLNDPVFRRLRIMFQEPENETQNP